jgi:hypothetical protein
MSNARLVRVLSAAGFVILLVELGLAAFSAFRVLHPPQVRHLDVFAESGWPVDVRIWLPTALLCVAAVAAGITLHRVRHGRVRRSWFGAILLPVAALLATHSSSVDIVRVLRVEQASLPWAAPYWLGSWAPGAFSLVLLIAAWALLPIYGAAVLLASRPRAVRLASTLP